MAPSKHRYFVEQIDALAHELSKLSVACEIELNAPGNAERILRNDQSVCGRKNPRAFEQMRHHLMALYPLEERAIERLGAEETLEILDEVRAAIDRLHNAGHPGG